MSDPIDAQTAGVSAVVVAAIGLAYRFFRVIKGDARADRATEFADKLRGEMADRMKELEERADRFAGERNAAMERAATLAERVKVLEEEKADRHSRRKPGAPPG